MYKVTKFEYINTGGGCMVAQGQIERDEDENDSTTYIVVNSEGYCLSHKCILEHDGSDDAFEYDSIEESDASDYWPEIMQVYGYYNYMSERR